MSRDDEARLDTVIAETLGGGSTDAIDRWQRPTGLSVCQWNRRPSQHRVIYVPSGSPAVAEEGGCSYSAERLLFAVCETAPEDYRDLLNRMFASSEERAGRLS